MDYTGTGNTLNMQNPFVLQLVMDSLRYWATRCTSTASASTSRRRSPAACTRSTGSRRSSTSSSRIPCQPFEADRRAMGRGRGRLPGRQLPAAVGRVERPVPRLHPRPLGGRRARGLGEFAYRITGSSDLYEAAGRKPHASINFVTAHDGFTLRDLVSYNEKHNEANGEDNNDGESHNRGWNCGAEGPTDDAEINELRARQQRNLLVDAVAVAGCADDPRRRRDRSHAGRQQQRLLPGQRGLVVRLEQRRPQPL